MSAQRYIETQAYIAAQTRRMRKCYPTVVAQIERDAVARATRTAKAPARATPAKPPSVPLGETIASLIGGTNPTNEVRAFAADAVRWGVSVNQAVAIWNQTH